MAKKRKREYRGDLTTQEAMMLVPNKPDPRFRRKRDTGRFTKKGLCHFLFELFETNEQLPATQRRTNTALAQVVMNEFPKNYELHERLKRGEKTGINYYRQRYNTGRLIPGKPIRLVSFRYNNFGDRVDYFTGKRLLTISQQKEIHAKFCNKIIDNYKKYYAKQYSAGNRPELPTS